MGGVFISYRNVDNPLGAAGIYDALTRRLGARNVFRDCVTVEAGTPYAEVIHNALVNSHVLVAVIGPQWLTLTDTATGVRLIDRDGDWVRRELAMAFQFGIPVVPVLLKDTPAHAPHPKPAELPDDIKPLAAIQAFALSQLRFSADLDRLAELLARLLPAPVHPGGNPPRPLPSTEFNELVSALEGVPCIANDDTRSLVVTQLRPAISGNIRQYPQRRAHVIGILRTCLDYERGVAELITAIASLERSGSIPFQDLIATLGRLLPEVMDQI
jgi:hypothetical protein